MAPGCLIVSVQWNALREGSVLASRYVIRKMIATGGMGEVWLADDRKVGDKVAIKTVRREFATDAVYMDRFRKEAKVSMALRHPNIATVRDFGSYTEDGIPLAYLALEYVRGKTLSWMIYSSERFTPEKTRTLLKQAADGLGAAHRAGVVHRDVKPGNFLVRDGDEVVKLTDFGIALARDSTRLTAIGTTVGTTEYMSPEQARGYDVDSRSDVYALGIVGYECLTGRTPFHGLSRDAILRAHINTPIPPLPQTVPSSLRQVIGKALQKDPDKRYHDGDDFSHALRKLAVPKISHASVTRVITTPAPPRGTRIQTPGYRAPSRLPSPARPTGGRPQRPPAGGRPQRAEARQPPPAGLSPTRRPSRPPRGAKQSGSTGGSWAATILVILVILAVLAGSFAYAGHGIFG